jgi:hypothetical protein
MNITVQHSDLLTGFITQPSPFMALVSYINEQIIPHIGKEEEGKLSADQAIDQAEELLKSLVKVMGRPLSIDEIQNWHDCFERMNQ